MYPRPGRRDQRIDGGAPPCVASPERATSRSLPEAWEVSKKPDPRAIDTPRRKSSEVDAFVRDIGRLPAARASSGRGRLLFAMDATASREPTWDLACAIQGEMFV